MKFFLDTNLIIILSKISKIEYREDKIREIKRIIDIKKGTDQKVSDKRIDDILFLEQELKQYKQDKLAGKPTRNEYCYNEVIRDEVMQGVSSYGIELKDYLAKSGLMYQRVSSVAKQNLAGDLSNLLLKELDDYECFYEENKFNSKNDAKIMADVYFQDGVVLTLDKHFLNVNNEVVYRIGVLYDRYKNNKLLESEFPNLDADRVASVKDHFNIIKNQKHKTDSELEIFVK